MGKSDLTQSIAEGSTPVHPRHHFEAAEFDSRICAKCGCSARESNHYLLSMLAALEDLNGQQKLDIARVQLYNQRLDALLAAASRLIASLDSVVVWQHGQFAAVGLEEFQDFVQAYTALQPNPATEDTEDTEGKNAD